jgi:hypothetical protein
MSSILQSKGWVRLSRDFYSKLVDGWLTAFILTFSSLTLFLFLQPIEVVFGKPGLFVYAVLMLAGGILCLDRGVREELSPVARASYGLAGGIFSWMVLESANYLSGTPLASFTGVLVLLMLSMMVVTLWNNSLTLGARFFSAAFLAIFGGRLIIVGGRQMFNWLPTLVQSEFWIAAALIVAAVVAGIFMTFFSHQRLERVWSGLIMAAMLVMAFFLITGRDV